MTEPDPANQLPLFPTLKIIPTRDVESSVRAARWLADWQRALAQAHGYCRARAQSDAERALYDELYEKMLAEGPDFLRYHKESGFTTPPLRIDRNDAAKIMTIARAIERGSWKERQKGKHGGALGRVAIRVLETLLFVVAVSRQGLAISYDALAELAGVCARTAFSAIQTLAFMGLVTIHRRVKRIRTALGFKVVQDVNAYEVHPPRAGIGLLARAIFEKPRSDCKSCEAKEYPFNQKGAAESRRPPWGVPDGVYDPAPVFS
jgi:hypothetical protein